MSIHVMIVMAIDLDEEIHIFIVNIMIIRIISYLF